MRRFSSIIVILTIHLSFFSIISCGESDDEAKDFELEIYNSNCNGVDCETLVTKTLKEEGEIIIDENFDTVLKDKLRFFIIAKAEGFFTDVYRCSYGDKILVCNY